MIELAITKLTSKQDLTSEEMQASMQEIMENKVSHEKIKIFLLGLRDKGETVDEITAAVIVLRKLMIPVNVNCKNLIDLVGTGGDQIHTFNISTASSFVAAAAGCHVAKHGNYGVSSKSGSANVLETAGINLNLSLEKVVNNINNIRIGFLFAPNYHKAMKYVASARKELGVRTIFNLLGPLINPTNPPNIFVGAYDKKWQQPFAKVLKQLHSEHALIVHSEDGMDEISISASTHIVELHHSTIKEYNIHPTQFGFKLSEIKTIQVDGPQQSLAIIQSVFDNQAIPARDIVAPNPGAAIYTAGLAKDIAEGIQKALTVIANGKAKQKWQQFIAASKLP